MESRWQERKLKGWAGFAFIIVTINHTHTYTYISCIYLASCIMYIFLYKSIYLFLNNPSSYLFSCEGTYIMRLVGCFIGIWPRVYLLVTQVASSILQESPSLSLFRSLSLSL